MVYVLLKVCPNFLGGGGGGGTTFDVTNANINYTHYRTFEYVDPAPFPNTNHNI